MHRAEPVGGPARARLLRFVLAVGLILLGGNVVAVAMVGRLRGTGSASAAAPPPAPSWFGLLAVRHLSDGSCHEVSPPPHSPVVTTPLPTEVWQALLSGHRNRPAGPTSTSRFRQHVQATTIGPAGTAT